MNLDYEIGEIIRKERKSQGLTMKELGKDIGVSEQAISQYELAKREIKFDMLKKIVGVFGMSVAKLLDTYGLYAEYLPENFNGDVDAFESHKKAFEENMQRESKMYNVVKTLLCEYGFTLNENSNTVSIKAPSGLEYKIEKFDFMNEFTHKFTKAIKEFSMFQITQILSEISINKEGVPQ